MFFISVAFALVTRDDLAINVSLVILSMLGMVMSKDLIRDAFFSLSSINWPTTKSKIKNSTVRYSCGDGDSNPYYWVHFAVEYSVNNQDYQYKFKNPNPQRFSTEVEAQEYAIRVDTGEELSEINYNPKNPCQSYIEPGLKVHHILGIPIGVGFVVVPVLSVLGFIKW
tara:strand:+ start:1630 stop:2133 length:504 start_codon:yes stop_codon:yes gene_type:complete